MIIQLNRNLIFRSKRKSKLNLTERHEKIEKEYGWKFVFIMNVFLTCISFSIVLPSLWPYLTKVSKFIRSLDKQRTSLHLFWLHTQLENFWEVSFGDGSMIDSQWSFQWSVAYWLEWLAHFYMPLVTTVSFVMFSYLGCLLSVCWKVYSRFVDWWTTGYRVELCSWSCR